MGYQVGNICYSSKKDADNVYFNSVAPVIIYTDLNYPTVVKSLRRLPPQQSQQSFKNGVFELIRPEYIKGQWFLKGRVINVNYPSCDISQNFKNGYDLGWLVFGVIAACYVFILIKKLLK